MPLPDHSSLHGNHAITGQPVYRCTVAIPQAFYDYFAGPTGIRLPRGSIQNIIAEFATKFHAACAAEIPAEFDPHNEDRVAAILLRLSLSSVGENKPARKRKTKPKAEPSSNAQS